MMDPDKETEKNYWSDAFDYDHYVETMNPLIEDLHEEVYDEEEDE